MKIEKFIADINRLPLDIACFMGAHTVKKTWVVTIASEYPKGSLFRNPLLELLAKYGATYEDTIGREGIVAYLPL